MSSATQRQQKGLGRLYGVGVGPGDPELMTLRAYNVLSRVPVIFVPLKDKESRSYAKSIVASLIPARNATRLTIREVLAYE